MLVYKYEYSQREGGYILLTVPVSKVDYLSYHLSQTHLELKYLEHLDSDGKYGLVVAPQYVPFDWIDNLTDILKDTIDIMAEVYYRNSDNLDYKKLLRTLLIDWTRGIPYDELSAMVNMICYRFENAVKWKSITGLELKIQEMGTNPNKLLTISTNGVISHKLAQNDEDGLTVYTGSSLDGKFKDISLESMQRAYVCTFLFSEFCI